MTIGAANSTHNVQVSKPEGQSLNAHLAFEDDKIKKNPLSNANLPGGIFTHPGVC